MNIILFFRRGNKVVRFSIGIFAGCALFFLVGFAGWGAYYLGYKQARAETEAIVHAVRAQTEPAWQTELREELERSRWLRERAESSLNAMAGRLSILQGHMMRLDALGSRLATIGKVDDIDFGTQNPLGMGGPESSSDISDIGPQRMPDMLQTLGELEESLLDGQDKLLVMESLLIDEELRERTLPSGRPVRKGWLSSKFGYRSHPITGKREMHRGVDYAGKKGTPILAVAAGIVTMSGSRYGYGNLVEVNHGNGMVTRYGHNLKNLVAVGERVRKGQAIAEMGSTGRSTGPHVHFEVLKNGKHINPKHYLPIR